MFSVTFFKDTILPFEETKILSLLSYCVSQIGQLFSTGLISEIAVVSTDVMFLFIKTGIFFY